MRAPTLAGVPHSSLSEILMVASETKINVSALNAKTQKDKNKVATITLSLEIANLTQLEHIITKIRKVKDVYGVQRPATSGGGL